jgi:CRISPR/Cas system type I-B associated protein Csh2 (Cas7 group RAMP superfamily)
MRYFVLSDFDCKFTGNNEMSIAFLSRLDDLRHACGFPFYLSSGYRDPLGHPIEANKPKAGTHGQGIAADVRVNNGAERYKIVSEAMKMGFTGIGIAKTFVHVDDRKTTPVVWSY